MMAVLVALVPLALAAPAHQFIQAGPWYDPMGPTVPGVKEVGRAY
jgi:hypothetical protein